MLAPNTPSPPGPGPGPADTPGSELHDALLALRARAEKRRQLVTQTIPPGTSEDTQRLVQELQVHQIELEMQYEELLLAQTDALTARLEYVDLYDFAPVGYFTLSETGQIRQLNLSGSQQLGTVRLRLLGRRFALFVALPQRPEFGQFLARVLQSERTQSIELPLQREDGTPFYAQLEGLRVEAADGPQCRLVVLDITARRQATAALAASEARFRKLFTDSFEAVVLMQGHQFVDANAAALRLVGAGRREQLVGLPVWSFTPERQPDGARTIDFFRASVAEAIQQGSKRCEALMYRLDGSEMWMEAVLTPIELGGPTPVVHIVWRDITEARVAATRLRREQEFTESLLANSVDGLLALDHDQRIMAWNAEMTRHFGTGAAQALGRPLAEVLPHLDDAGHDMVRRALAGQRTDYYDQPFQARPGFYDVHAVPLRAQPGSTPTGVLVIIRDVTERTRLAEETTRQRLRQQQEVLAAILSTQETERKRIAEALHNGLGQLLYATKLSLTNVPGISASGQGPMKLLDEAIRTARTISFELTPGILEDFGLHIALEELVKRVAQAQLPVRLHLTNLDARLPAPVEIGVYRTVQELLNNVMKHARATGADVHVAREAATLEVSVEDDGCGFEPARLASQPLAGIGLAGVRNRVALLGGELHISSRLGLGTIVSFELPL